LRDKPGDDAESVEPLSVTPKASINGADLLVTAEVFEARLRDSFEAEK
jgi:hypothetical protein